MKNLYCSVSILLFPFLMFAQNIHGLWTGTLVNDSTHHTQNFELGLSEYKGKITGYTYTTFIDADTFYYSIKRIKAERKAGKLVIEDVEMVGNNFPERAAKHVKQTTEFPLINDSTIDVSNGRWSTNQTKKYYSIGGSATIREQADEKGSDMMAHLQEANIKTDIVANDQQKKAGSETFTKSAGITASNDHNIAVNSNHASPGTKTGPGTDAGTPADAHSSTESFASSENVNEDVAATQIVKRASIADDHHSTKSTTVKTISNQSLPKKNLNLPKETSTQTAQVNDRTVARTQLIQNSSHGTSSVKTDLPASIRPQQQVETVVDRKESIETHPVNTPVSQIKQSIDHAQSLPNVVANRKNEDMQELYFKNDSLVLSLYDNGIVDGDTVSVYLNGETIISKQMLKAVATKKTIYLSPQEDSVQLILFAENLGTIPPNTGLLTVRDGDDLYQVRFSADLQKNASITLRRKK